MVNRKHNAFSCDSSRVEDFLEDKLDQTEESEVMKHLDHCDCCRELLQHAAADTGMWNELKSALKDQPHDGVLLGSAAGIPLDGAPTNGSSLVNHVLGMLAPTDDPEMLGRLGPYEVSGVIGSGGMGVVLKGHDRSLDRTIAIKFLAPHLASSGAAKKRFFREARAAAAVLHPNVIAIHSVSEDMEIPYLVMPYIRGASLQKRIDLQGPLPLSDVLRIGAQVAAGLAAAHAQGLVHRDIKPANIMLEDGIERVAITDFGLARAVDDATMTRSGVIAGTPQYMSPEQSRGDSIDQRSDLFSLGSVLYATCTGRPPFRAETTYGVMRRITEDMPTGISEVNSDIPEWLCKIINKLMSKRPDDRFESASEVAQLLEKCLAHIQQPTTVPLPESLVAQTTGSRLFSNSVLSKGFIAMTAVFSLSFLGMFLWQASNPPDISGRWAGDEWGVITLKAVQPGSYEGSADSNTGKSLTFRVKWSRVERRFNGSWKKGRDSNGKVSLRVVDKKIRGGWTTVKPSRDAKTPRIGDLLWVRDGTKIAEATSLPGDSDNGRPELDRTNVRTVAETYLATAIAKKTGEPISPRIMKFAESMNLSRVVIGRVYVCETSKPAAALAISQNVRISPPQPDGQDEGLMVFTLTKVDNAWYVTDVDFETQDGADKELKRFLGKHPNSIVSPPLQTPLPEPERNSLPRSVPDDPSSTVQVASKKPLSLTFYLAHSKPAESLNESTVHGSDRKVYVANQPFATSLNVVGVRVISDSNGKPAIEITFKSETAKRLQSLTAQHRGKMVAIIMDGELRSAPRIIEVIGSQAVIRGPFSREEAKRIVYGIVQHLELVKTLLQSQVSDVNAEPIWGQPQNQLQLALIGISNNMRFKHGSTIRFQLMVKNVGNETIRLQYHRLKNCPWIAPLVEKVDGERVRMDQTRFRGGHLKFVETLEPQSVALIRISGILTMGGDPAQNKVRPYIPNPDPGEYRLTAGSPPFYIIDSKGKRIGDWFTLATGSVKVHIEETAVSESSVTAEPGR